MATSPDTQPHEPEIPLPPATDEPQPDQPIEPIADLPPETVNAGQNDEPAQSQTVADAASDRGADDFELEDSDKLSDGEDNDDVQDLVDHMHDMVHSGRIDMDAYRGERNDDGEDGMYGPGGDDD